MDRFETITPINADSSADAAKPTPDDPPWGSGVAVGFWILSVGFIVFIPLLFLLPYAFSISSPEVDRNEFMNSLTTDPVAIALQILAIIPAHLLTVGLAWLVVTKGGTYSFKETLGWRSGGVKWWYYVLILLAFFGLAVVVGTFLPEQETELTRILKSSRYAVFLVAFMATFTAPIVEEVVYRGVLYSALQRSFGVKVGVAVVTLLFALVHVPQYLESVSTMLLLLVLSLVLTVIRAKTGNLLPCVILHTVFNGLQSVLLIIEPYLKTNSTAEDAAAALHLMMK